LRSNVLRAECALHAGNAFEARQRLERAVPLMERAYAPNHPRVALTQVLLAESLLALQEPEAAREKFQHALALQEAESGPNHSWLADALIGIGESWLVQRDPDRARAPIERAMTLLADSGNRYASGRARFALAKVLNALGQDPTQAAQLARLAQDDLQAGRPRSAQLSELRRWMTLHH
jgi:tetratricopeptide (TPR) repeat protein